MRRLVTFSAGLASGLFLFILVACAQQTPGTRGPAPEPKTLETPRALPAVDPNTLLDLHVAFSDVKTMSSVWLNTLRKPFTVHTVLCKTSSGNAEIMPVTEPGEITSILTNTCPCRPGDTWSQCVVNGFPVIRPYAEDGSKCATPPCELSVLVIKPGNATELRVSITGPVGP